MQRITWYPLLAVVALAAPIAGHAQAPRAQGPRANVRELATIDGDVTGFVRLPTAPVLLYSIGDSTFAYDMSTRRGTPLGTNMYPQAISPQGDRFAFVRRSEDGRGNFVWTMPVDPRTGRGTGPAQRVSLRGEGFANTLSVRFSPDGRTIVYRAGPLPDRSYDVTLVPATGGTERVVANHPWQLASGWSADGRALYVEVNMPGHAFALERVPTAGGRSEGLFPASANSGCWIVGVPPEARVGIFQCNPDGFFFLTAGGEERWITVDLPPLDDGWGYDLTLDSMRYLTMTQVSDRRVRVLSLGTGQVRDVSASNVPSRLPIWSPDGRRLAMLSGIISHQDITVMNADGSAQRRYPIPQHLSSMEAWAGQAGWWAGWPWSPDGHFLAFQVDGRHTVTARPHDREGRQIALLDLSSGEIRVLGTSTTFLAAFRWRADGNAIIALKQAIVPRGSAARWSVVEFQLNGTERLLREVSAEFPEANDVLLTSDRTVVVLATTNGQPERFLVPLDGGAASRLPDPGTEPGLVAARGALLVAGNRLLVPLFRPGGRLAAFKLVSTVGDTTRTLRFPFDSQGPPWIAGPDGTQLVVISRAAGDSVNQVHLVPLDGSPPRLLGTGLAGARVDNGRVALSPDGTLLAFTSEGRYTSRFFDVDFGPALRAITRR
jgi:Tol biopolymer transport system component